MASTPRKFLETARLLLNEGSGESDWRAAVSRAYYAAYHLVIQKTRSRVNYTGAGDHAAARLYLKNNASRRKFRTFEDLQDARIVADYELSRTFTGVRSEQLVGRAEKFCEDLDKESLKS